METSQSGLSVHQLEELWKEHDAAAPGTVFYDVPSIRQMPPWDQICFMLNWEFHLPDGDYFSAKHHGFCGVYRLIALASEGDAKPATLNRVGGQDASGTLYIGESSNLSQRLNRLLRSGWGGRNEDSHGAIGMLKQIAVLDYFPRKLGITLLFTVRDTRGVERDLIKAYMNSFGDTPPLNYRL